uniref:TPR_REGION domain-containing protein n=1 Tax=Ascaris lumbricoides TaxID=6252 RepID=A0A0M3HY11_ASCLU
FDKASLKLGLDKAVLQSTTALKDTSQQLSRKEVEELLKKGAYGAIMEENNEDSKFNEEDIDTILQRRTTTITLEAGIKGSTFAKASFNSSTNREDIDIDDPNFWSKWAKKANIDTEMSQSDKELILLEPRNRKKRFEENIYKAEGGDDSDGEESDESGKGRKRGERKGDRKRRREDEEYRPDELAFNKSEYFKVEKLLAQYGWGRWKAMREASDLKESVSEADIEHISRTLLLHCIREYRGDEKVREFVWRLIIPKGGQVPGKTVTKKKPANNLTSVFHEGWAALPEFNPPAFAVDSSFQRHVHRHANKLLVRMHQLHILNTEVIGSRSEAIMSGAKADDVDLSVEMNEPFFAGWDAECDKSFLIGAHKHGVENYDAMRVDEALCFAAKSLETFPSGVELLARWSKREEAEFMRVLRSYGVKDDPSTIISWTRFRQLSPLLEKKSDSELMEQLYCVLSMCTKQLGNQMSTVDLQRAMKVEPISARKAQKLMHRMNMMRQIHDWADSLPDRASLLKLCSSEAMPNGWSVEQDDDLFTVVDSNGLDNISVNIAHRPAFQKIIRPEEKTLLRRIAEIYTTLQTKKWNGTASIELLEDSDEEASTPLQSRIKRGRKKGSLSNGTAMRDLVDAEKEKMRALVHQSFLQRLEQLPLAAAAAMAQGAFLLPQLLTSGSSSAQQAAMLSSLFGGLPSTSSASASTTVAKISHPNETTTEDALNLSTKRSVSTPSLERLQPVTSSAASASTSQPASALINTLNFSELLALANLPPETHVPVVNIDTGLRLSGDQAPKVKNLGQWLSAHPKFVLDIPSSAGITTASNPTPSTSGVKVAETSEKTPSSTEQIVTPEKTVVKKEDSAASLQTSSASSDPPKEASTSPAASTSKTPSTALEPGEIPKSTPGSLGDQPVAVFDRTTGTLLSADRWPSARNLPAWLDKHPECNVHSSSAPIAAMQMMLQQSLMNQSLLGLSAYNPLGPYAMLAAAASSAPSSSNKVGGSKDVLNPMLASLMNPSSALQLQQMQSLLALDPSLLFAAQASLSGAPLLPTPLASVGVQSPAAKANTVKKTPAKGRLNAVVEKLSSNQT